MNNDTVVLQHNCSACDKSGKIYLTKDTNTEYCLDCFRENACGECYNAEECTCKQEDSEDEEEEEDSEDEEEDSKETQFLYRVNLLKEATECGIIKEITEEGKAFQLKMEQEDSEDEEEEEQIYCDHCSRHTNAETATECGWVGDEETGDWKCVMCVLIEKTLEEKRHAEIHNASLTKRVRNR